MDVIANVKNGGAYILSDPTSTSNFFNQYGLEVAHDEYSYSISNIRTLLLQGKYIAIWFYGGGVVGKSGDRYNRDASDGMHWIAIIGYSCDEDGNENIFISDPGWGSSGWKDIDEFENCQNRMEHFSTVYEKR